MNYIVLGMLFGKSLLAFWDETFLKIRYLNYWAMPNLIENLPDGAECFEACVHKKKFSIEKRWAKLVNIYV